MIHATQVHSVRAHHEQEYLEGWQRARAELANYRKRAHEQAEATTLAFKHRLLEPLITLADHFQALVTHIPADFKDHAWVQGVGHIARQFGQTLADFEVMPINQANTAFDPRIHEAIAQVKQPGVEAGMVVEIIQPGYTLPNRVIRPARVKVSQ